MGVSTDIPSSLSKESSGDTAFDFTATFVNNGPTDATGVVFTDTLPTGVTYVSATPSQGDPCTKAGNTVTCNLGGINKDATATVAIALTVASALPVGTTFTNVAGVYGDGVDLEDSNDVKTRDAVLSFWDASVGDPGLGGTVNALSSWPFLRPHNGHDHTPGRSTAPSWRIFLPTRRSPSCAGRTVCGAKISSSM